MTTTKHDYSNFGTIEKQVRRYSTLWNRYSRRWDNNTVKTDPREEVEADERGTIRVKIHRLGAYPLGNDIINSIEDGLDYCVTNWVNQVDNHEYLLGVAQGLGLKKVVAVVHEQDVKSLQAKANRLGWESHKTNDYHNGIVPVLLINRSQDRK